MEAQKKKGDEPSTPMSSHSAPSPPTATAGTAAGTGVTPKGKGRFLTHLMLQTKGKRLF